MSSPFAQPSAGGDKFEPKDFGGALILVYPKSYNPNESTQFGQSTSADCDIVVVDRQDPQTGQPVIKHNARLFGNLANSVRDSIGGQVLGRLGQVPTNKGNPAWTLQSFTDADAALAGPVHQAYQAGQFQAPATPAAAPTPAPTPSAATPAPASPAAPTAAAPTAAAPAAGDPNVVKLISAGLDPAQVAGMDPATRAAIAATL